MTFAELREACEIMGLGEKATLAEIKARHKALVKRYHPDSGNAEDPEAIRQVNAAYRLLMAYVGGYRFSFTRQEFYEQNPEARIEAQFADDPIWGGR